MSEEMLEMNGAIPGADVAQAEQPPVRRSEQSEVQNEILGSKGFASIDMLMDVQLLLTVELGRTQMVVRQVLDLQKGSVIELNRIAGDAVDVYVNEHLFARGEVVVVDDKFGVRISELVSPSRELAEG